MQVYTEFTLPAPLGQLRAAPVDLGPGRERAFLVIYGPDFDCDPYEEMFFIPKGGLTLAVYTVSGRRLWSHELGRGVLPGMWFCPVLPFDLDGDGCSEIFFVGNPDEDHPLAHSQFRLYCLDAATGRELGNWPWPRNERWLPLSQAYRNFLLGGFVHGKPVLVTAQGTYSTMKLQGWNPGLEPRWETVIRAEDPGARGSHMCPVLDWNADGVDEFFWGERLLELDGGRELLCLDRDTYRGHSDIVQPVPHPETGEWHLYTCRESDGASAPRVNLYRADGTRVWGALDHGHIDMGWVANLDGRAVASAIRIGAKTLGPGGRFHANLEEFAWDLWTGKEIELGFSTYRSLPVDTNGDGRHELIRGHAGGDGMLLSPTGAELAPLHGTAALAGKFCDLPGEQLLIHTPDGQVRLWHDPSAQDTPAALKRYAHPFYQSNLRLTATGSNHINLGGLV